MLDAGVAVIDGNLGSQGPAIQQPVGVDRGSAQPRLQRLNQAQVRGRQWWLALSSRLRPGEHYPHYSHERRESIHSEELFSIPVIVQTGQAWDIIG